LNRVRGMLVILLAALTLLACDTSTFVSLLNRSTPTPTMTRRPTFTPRPAATPTPEDTPTPEPTATTAASPTPTRRPVVVATPRPPTAKPPVAPPAPVFAWKQSPSGNQGRCDAGPSVYEVKGRVHDGAGYTAGIHVMALDKDNKIIAQSDSWGPGQMNPEWGVSCFESKNNYNYQLDLSAGRNATGVRLRLTRGLNDQTPISPDVPIDLSTSGRWYIDWTK